MDKPFKTIDEQIELLNSRGLITDKRSRDILSREGYYCVVNGYKDLFIDKNAKSAAGGDDRFYKGVTFDHVYRLFEFDRDLRLRMFRYFARAEAVLKTACSYCFTERHQTECEPYLNKMLYRREDRYRRDIDALIRNFEKILTKDPSGTSARRRSYIDHYLNNHDEVPLWVLANFTSLGMIFKFFTFQKESMRNEIARYFSTLYETTHGVKKRFNPEQLRLAYDHIKDFRNICAHDERLYCARVSPSKDVSLSNVIDDLSDIMQVDEMVEMRTEVSRLILGVIRDTPSLISESLLKTMGFSSVKALIE
ncbi:Abi family protein [Raoultibacter phocaeensis]|uniref:Abi family protein n=1 Tax=Raoultibacter phocaeensis TaxID=2479841 RepID=UPI0015D5989B|nr:Abi family protein [Raoultibacter phocaeensis]